MDDPAAASSDRPRLASRIARSDTFASLRLPQFRFLMAGTAFQQVGSWMQDVARGWLVLELGGGAFELGLLGFISGISQLVISPIAGVLADRLDRRRLAAITQIVPAVDMLLVAVLITTDQIELWQLYPIVAIGGVANAINYPTRQILVYDVVGGENITNAIALNAVTSNISRIIAPSVGGIIVGTIGTGASYYMQAAFFVLATVATLQLHPQRHVEANRTPVWESLREGFGYVRGDATVSRLVLLNCIPNLLIYPYVAMIPLIARDELGVGSAGYGILLTGVGFGSIPGGLIVANMTNSSRKGLVMCLAALFYMAMVMLFSLSTVFILSFGILVLAGVGWSMMVTLNQTLLQTHITDELRGRVLSLYTMAGGLQPFGNLAMGATAEEIGVRSAVFAFAALGFASSAALGLASKRVRSL